jgi:predicted dithiol-disulfide oxidoreductase (DUF899 family)
MYLLMASHSAPWLKLISVEGKAYYNYEARPIDVSDEQEISVFYKNDRGEVFHT